MKKSKVIVIIVAALTLLTWGTSTFMEYRERSLDSIIPLQSSAFVSLLVTDDLSALASNDLTPYITEDLEAVHELLEFLGTYTVKKTWSSIGYSADDPIVAYVTITHEQMRPTTVMIYDDYVRTSIGKQKYYTIVDGPIDEQWLESWEEKHLK